ncbi:MAG: phosphoglucomutase [Proteobacteria bacterium]|nr:phosphoglucomutase [Pseudomonadota bacterium]MBU1709262.1 phosphoglucomutase [Pseudomonadota bacterium]
MNDNGLATEMYQKHITPGNHAQSDYFAVIKKLVGLRESSPEKDSKQWQDKIDEIYRLVQDEISTNTSQPVTPVKFGTSGWRGILGKDFFLQSITQVTLAIISLYQHLERDPQLASPLGVNSLDEAKVKGCVLGFDNRFGGEWLAKSTAEVLTSNGFTVHYAGESSTGALSAAVLELKAAFSINLTPSHNPLEYAGFKYNAADAGPAAQVLTDWITKKARAIISENPRITINPDPALMKNIDALELWKQLVIKNKTRHGLDYDGIINNFIENNDLVVAVDCVHGASRVNIRPIFKDTTSERLLLFRADQDYTFGGVAPEPSSANMKLVMETLHSRPELLKLGMIIDPDADRIRFTDGTTEISMNQFGAMAYHFLHEIKRKTGMVAKTVATSNFANALAAAFDEEIFEPAVGFKEFKPVIDKSLVCFEESDGITVIGHTPEKDAYIGLILALDMVLTLNKNLGDYLLEIQNTYGKYFPDRDSVRVSLKGEELLGTLANLKKYTVGSRVAIGDQEKTIKKIIDIDGLKMIFEDESWIMIRPSGTEPKVRFYVEARTDAGRAALFTTAMKMLGDIGLV